MILVWLFACDGGPCTNGELTKVSTALGQVSREMRQPLAAQGLVEACEFPEPVEQALQGVANGMPGTVEMFDRKVAVDAPELWAAACPGGPAALAEAMSMPSTQARRKLHETCQLQRYGWDSSTFASAGGPMVLPIVLSHAMEGEQGFPRTVVLDALAGL